MTEVWRPVPGYEGRYEVSNTGKVKRLYYSIEKRRKDGSTYVLRYPEKILNQTLGSGGYYRVKLRNGDNVKTCAVHILVAKAFIPNTLNRPMVNHIDGCKTNCEVSNLEWVTGKENSKHAKETGLLDTRKTKVKCLETGVVYPSIRNAEQSLGIRKNGIRNSMAAGTKVAGYTFVKLPKTKGKQHRFFELD